MFGGPYTINAYSIVNKTKVTLSLEDILFGDVWICSGQSNMEFTVGMVGWANFNYLITTAIIMTAPQTVDGPYKVNINFTVLKCYVDWYFFIRLSSLVKHSY